LNDFRWVGFIAIKTTFAELDGYRMNKPFLSSSKRTLSLTSSGLVAVCLFLVALAATPVVAKGSGEKEMTSLTTLRSEVRNLLRQEATLDPGPAKEAAGTALCDLYVILRNDEI